MEAADINGNLRNRNGYRTTKEDLSSPAQLTTDSTARSSDLILFRDLPFWLQGNEFLVGGHRKPCSSFLYCLRSVFYLHSESLNIWTHTAGFLLFVWLAFFSISNPLNQEWERNYLITGYLIGATVCFGFSSTFHMMMCFSEPVKKFFNRLDYAGIAVMIICSVLPVLYFAFECHPATMMTYMALIMLCGSICIVMSLRDEFSKPQFLKFRAGLFLSLAYLAMIPIVHYVILHGLWSSLYKLWFRYLLSMAAANTFGAIIYATRIPERFHPGRFDVYGHSHQIFHVCVVVGALLHYAAITELANERPCVSG